MANRRRDKGVSVRKANLALLEFEALRWRGEIDKLEAQRGKLKSEFAELPTIEAEILKIRGQLAPLYEVKAPKPGLLGTVLGLIERPKLASERIAALEQIKARLESSLDAKKRWLPYRIADTETALEKARRGLRKFEQGAATRRRKDQAIVELKARAASNAKEVRIAANGVRRKLARHDSCPYCGGELGADAHADHIYPVAEGGRSVPSNMVHVCSKCNSMKSDLTLRAFILKFSLDRDAIERRLTELNKNF